MFTVEDLFKMMIMAPAEDGGAGGAGAPDVDGGDAPEGDAPDTGTGPETNNADDAPDGDDAPVDNSEDTKDPVDNSGKEAKTDTDAPEGDDKPVQNTFPKDWREQMAGGDEKAQNILKRFNTPKDLFNSYTNLQNKIDSGEFQKPLSEDASDEEVAKYREKNGIPEKPEGYLEELPEGLVFGEGDEDGLKPFLEQMHNNNVQPNVVHEALQAYNNAKELQTDSVQENDIRIQQETQDALNQEWGEDYRANMNAVSGFIDNFFPAEIKESLHNARLGDDQQTPLLHDARVLRSFAQLGRLFSPGSIKDSGGNDLDSLDTINEQIKELEGRMGTKEWFRDEKANQRYRDLITMRNKIQDSESKA